MIVRLPVALALSLGLSGMLGAQGPCALVHDIRPGSGGSFPLHLTPAWGNSLYFQADDGVHGTELWIRDRMGQTRLVKDIRAGAMGSGPQGLASGLVGGRPLLAFSAEDGLNGRELWISDGTGLGTRMLADIAAGVESSDIGPVHAGLGKFFFSAWTVTEGREPWVSDGTAAGTQRLQDIYPGGRGSKPLEWTTLHDRVYFTAENPTNGNELWVTDGTPAGTRLAVDVYPSSGSSTPLSLIRHQSYLVFSAFTPGEGREPWVSDGTSAGTRRIADVNPGYQSSSPFQIASGGDKIYFNAVGGPALNDSELWESDLTTAGTRLLRDIWPGSGSSVPNQMTWIGDRLIFAARDGNMKPGGHGNELWIHDQGGTRLLKDIYVGSDPVRTADSAPFFFVRAGRGAFFAAQSLDPGMGGRELWFTDGTTSGTRQVCDLLPGFAAGGAYQLVVAGGRVFFGGTDAAHGGELFEIQTEALVEVLPVGRNRISLTASQPAILGQQITLTADNGPAGHTGVLGLSLPSVFPVALPSDAIDGAWLDFASTFWLRLNNPPRFEVRSSIPMTTALGTRVQVQAFWISLLGPVPYQVSNGLQLTVGR